MEVKTIGVIGAGTMGRGIAYAAALGGYRTILEDVMPEILAKGTAWIQQAFEEGVKRGKVPARRCGGRAFAHRNRVECRRRLPRSRLPD